MAAVGFGTRRMLARQKPEKRKRRKRLANRECFDKPAQYVAILDVRVHIFCSRSCALVYSRQLPPGKNKCVEIIVAPGTCLTKHAAKLQPAERSGSNAVLRQNDRLESEMRLSWCQRFIGSADFWADTLASGSVLRLVSVLAWPS